MSDKDREAFEEWNWVAGKAPHDAKDSEGNYRNSHSAFAWQVWQASRDHYSPKLTEKGAVEALESRAELIEPCNDDGVSSGKLMVGIGEAVRVLRAAGARFREEA